VLGTRDHGPGLATPGASVKQVEGKGKGREGKKIHAKKEESQWGQATTRQNQLIEKNLFQNPRGGKGAKEI